MLETKDDLLNKLRAFASTPDDDNIKYKEFIKNALLKSPELLYALHEKDLESELFDKNGNINVDENGNPLGEWDRYFGSNSNIRPFIFVPQTQTDIKHYLCYQVGFTEVPRYGKIQKYTEITFTIFVNGTDGIDELTGIPRHDLIASIIRERFNWSSIFGMQTRLISDAEATTDGNFLVRTLVFQILDVNSIVNTPYEENTYVIDNEYWR